MRNKEMVTECKWRVKSPKLRVAAVSDTLVGGESEGGAGRGRECDTWLSESLEARRAATSDSCQGR